MIGVGDKVVCIKSGRVTREGVIYTVSEMQLPGEFSHGTLNAWPEALLWFHELPNTPGKWSSANRFRKIQHDKREACEDAFVTLLDRIKQGEEA